MVIATIPQEKIPELPKDMFAGISPNVVVVDTGNYYPRQRDCRIAHIENGATRAAGCRATWAARS